MTLPLLLNVWRKLDELEALSPGEWDLLLRQARAANILPTLALRIERAGYMSGLSRQVFTHLDSASRLATSQRWGVQRELALIARALERHRANWVLTKGAAYVAADLPVSHGRMFSDVDLIVPLEQLPQVEADLMQHGWVTTHHDEYDQRYYRTWMHELPPMQHIKRATVVDVHHAILPKTARLRPDTRLLLADAQTFEVAGCAYQTLHVRDLLLHSATHLMHEAELHHALRDLIDIAGLIVSMQAQGISWEGLVQRALLLDVGMPLFYALRYCVRLLGVDVPDSVFQQLTPQTPGALAVRTMDALFLRAIWAFHPSCAPTLCGLSGKLMYVRGHWLRMPPMLLMRHLFHKAFISPQE